MNTREQYLHKRLTHAEDTLIVTMTMLNHSMNTAAAFAWDVGMNGADAAAGNFATALREFMERK